MAQSLQARFIVLEHRYYGESLPYNHSEMLPQLLSNLNVEQALADTAQFIRFINSQMTVKPKWVVVGGSYAGGLSAWLKTRYTDLIQVS